MAAVRDGEEDSDMDLTYGEVEQRLDLLQQHLNRWEEGTAPHTTALTATWIKRKDVFPAGESDDWQPGVYILSPAGFVSNPIRSLFQRTAGSRCTPPHSQKHLKV